MFALASSAGALSAPQADNYAAANCVRTPTTCGRLGLRIAIVAEGTETGTSDAVAINDADRRVNGPFPGSARSDGKGRKPLRRPPWRY